VPPTQPAILISGYTAAGKTTHAQLLAQRLHFEYLSASQIRRTLLGSPSENGMIEWDRTVDERRKASSGPDRALDAVIAQRVRESRRPLVVDAWLQPWLSADPAHIRVWLESSVRTRNWKATVTLHRNGLLAPADLYSQVAEKDSFSRKIFWNLYQIEFGPDPRVFDVIIDNSAYITAPTIQASDAGIAQFEPVLEQAIKERCRQAPVRTASFVPHMLNVAIPSGKTNRYGMTKDQASL
jgi:cytidylate kinase